MIPMIGLMIGFYIIFRMIDAIASPSRNTFVKTCAVLVILSTAFFMFGLAESSGTGGRAAMEMLR